MLTCAAHRTRRGGMWRSRSPFASGSRERERPGCHPVSQDIGAVSAEQNSVRRTLPPRQADPVSAAGVCTPWRWSRSTASVPCRGAGDGLQPSQPAGVVSAARRRRVSHAAIAAALALEDVSAGERLAAFALASFANSDHRAWPGTRIAAVRAGLSRSQYLAARDGLVKRGLVVVEAPGGGRGNRPGRVGDVRAGRPVGGG